MMVKKFNRIQRPCSWVRVFAAHAGLTTPVSCIRCSCRVNHTSVHEVEAVSNLDAHATRHQHCYTGLCVCVGGGGGVDINLCV